MGKSRAEEDLHDQCHCPSCSYWQLTVTGPLGSVTRYILILTATQSAKPMNGTNICWFQYTSLSLRIKIYQDFCHVNYSTKKGSWSPSQMQVMRTML